MSEPTTIFQVPEPIYVTLLISWIVACVVAFVAGFFVGSSRELRKRLRGQ